MAFKYDVIGKVRFGSELEDILKSKGITDIDSFLNPTARNVENELLLDNIEKARDVFVNHVSNNDIIDLLVDCDVDGFTSASNIYQYIKRLNPDIKIRYFIHNGKIHGLSEFVDSMYEDDSKLIIVPDAGSGDSKECRKLIEHGKDVIILDHHDVDASENPAIVVNNQHSKRVTDKAMTGVGITYKFTKLLDKYYKVNYADDYLDLVTLGMIADRADMLNLETRYLILKGLEQIKNKTNMNKLISTFVNAQMYSMNNKVTINGIAFYVSPLINSMIRVGEYEDKCYMFEALCNSNKMLDRKVRGKGVANMTIQEYTLKACQSSNRKQKKIIEEVTPILSEEINKFGLDKFPIIICNARDNVDGNFTGLIANRLADQYQRPCLLMRRNGDVCRGSGRGNDKCEILDFNQWCKNTGLFNEVEGHAGAFGCKINFENTNKLFALLSTMRKIDEPTYHVYNVYNANNIHDQIIKNIAKYDYVWGTTVSPPLFLIKSIPCNKYNLYLLGSKQNRIEFTYHNIKFVKQTKGRSLAALYKEIISIGDNFEFDIVGKFSIDYKSNKTAEVLIDDWMFYKSDKAQGFFG